MTFCRPATSASASSRVLYIANEARPVAGHVEAHHQRLRAVMAGADGDPLFIEDRADVVRVNAFEHEGDDAGLFRRGADDAQAVDFEQAFRGVVKQILFVRGDRVDADRGDVVERRGQADDAFDVRRARFEFVRQRVVGRLLETDGEDHVAAALPRRHGVEDRLLAVQHAGAGRAVDLVRGERVEVAVELANVDVKMRNALRAVDERRWRRRRARARSFCGSD